MRLFHLLPLCLAACFYVTAEQRAARGDLDEDGVGWSEDCDPADPSVGAVVWFADQDMDGFGDASDRVRDCEQPDGYVDNSDDCNDRDPQIKPGAEEVCNGVDDDCDGSPEDASIQSKWYEDEDGDGQGDLNKPVFACDQPTGAVANHLDCDDSDASIRWGGVEVCDGLGIDEDCNGLADLEDTENIDPIDFTYYLDGDGDGYGVDDPLTNEITCSAPSSGYVAPLGDCDDLDPNVSPGEDEICNGIDDDCNAATDGAQAVDAITYYFDADGDGRAGAGITLLDCQIPGPDWYEGPPTDCDDNEPCAYPGAVEFCDTLDNDCDGTPDDNCVPQGGDTGGGECG